VTSQKAGRLTTSHSPCLDAGAAPQPRGLNSPYLASGAAKQENECRMMMIRGVGLATRTTMTGPTPCCLSQNKSKIIGCTEGVLMLKYFEEIS